MSNLSGCDFKNSKSSKMKGETSVRELFLAFMLFSTPLICHPFLRHEYKKSPVPHPTSKSLGLFCGVFLERLFWPIRIFRLVEIDLIIR